MSTKLPDDQPIHAEWKREFTLNQLSDLENTYIRTRADRIRAAMFPETLPGIAQAQGEEIIPSTQYFKDHQTAVGRLAEPAQMLKQAIVRIINYQDDAEVAQKAIPELIKLLKDNDEEVKTQAAHIAHQMAKKEASRYPMMQHREMVPAIVNAIMTTSDPRAHKDLTATLRNFSLHKPGLLTIYKNGGIPALLKMLTSTVDTVVFYAITTLHNLIRYQDGAKHAIQTHGGIKIMVALLHKDHAKFLAINCDCLQLLCFGSQENKITALSAGCPQSCVRILRQYTYEQLQWTCCRLLKVLSVCGSNKPVIVQSQGMAALGNILHCESPRVVQNSLWTLRNLSDAAGRVVGLNSLLETLIKFLTSKDIAVLQCAAGILSNLTCNNAENKRIVYQASGVSALIDIMQTRDGHEREELTEPSVCALRHLTSRHPDDEGARNEIVSKNAMPILSNLLSNVHTRNPLKKAVIGLIRNMALSDNNQHVFRDLQLIDKLSQNLDILQQDLVRNNENNATLKMVEGVGIEDIIEGTVGSLHIFARHPENVQIMKNYNIVQTAVSLLSRCSDINIQRGATGLLCELAADQQLALEIDQTPGAMKHFASLLHSRNEAVATYAAATMHRLTEQKSEDERKRMSINIQREWRQDGNMYHNQGTLGTNQQHPTNLSTMNRSELAANDQTTNYSIYNTNNSNNNQSNHMTPQRQTSAGPAHNNNFNMNTVDRSQAYHYAQSFEDDSRRGLLNNLQQTNYMDTDL